MTGIVEKNYSEALFQAVMEDKPDTLRQTENELLQIGEILDRCPEFAKLMNAPTVSAEDKHALIDQAFAKSVLPFVLNFLHLVAQEKRMSCFGRICAEFKAMCNEHFGIAEITVTTVCPLTDAQRTAVKARMAQVIGKTIVMTEKTDPTLVGGIVVEHGDRRIDGSVRTRLESLRESLSEMIG